MGSDIHSSGFWTSNAEGCQKLCQDDNSCEYWTWILEYEYDGIDGSCYLKNSKGRVTNKDNATSGPKYCSIPTNTTMTNSPLLLTNSCNTVGGPNPSNPCMFPFFWRGISFDGKC